MAETLLVGIEPNEAGINPDPMTAADPLGFYWDPKSGRFELEVDNQNGGPIVITMVTPFTGGVNALEDNAITIPNGERRLIRIKASELQYYLGANPDTGQANSVVKCSFDLTTGVTVSLRYFL